MRKEDGSTLDGPQSGKLALQRSFFRESAVGESTVVNPRLTAICTRGSERLKSLRRRRHRGRKAFLRKRRSHPVTFSTA